MDSSNPVINGTSMVVITHSLNWNSDNPACEIHQPLSEGHSSLELPGLECVCVRSPSHVAGLSPQAVLESSLNHRILVTPTPHGYHMMVTRSLFWGLGLPKSPYYFWEDARRVVAVLATEFTGPNKSSLQFPLTFLYACRATSARFCAPRWIA